MNLNLGDTQLIISECKKHKLPLNDVAYILATAYHETAHTMKPVREYGGEKYLKSKKYYPYVGMGYVQLTWDYNYKKAGKKFNVDFMKDPKLLLLPKYAAPTLVVGMIEGWFTGKKLRDYIDTIDESDAEDLLEFNGARRIVNGNDKKALIAGYALQYEKALKASGYSFFDTEKPTQIVVDDPGVEVPKTSKPSLVSLLVNLLVKLLGGK